MSDPARWTTTAQIADAVRRRWTDGTLLRAVVGGKQCPLFDLPLRGPSAVDLGDHFDAATAWAAALRRGSRDGRAFDLELTTIGGRGAGRSEVPFRAVVSRYDQAWRLLDVAAEVAAFQQVVELCADEPEARAWVLARPVAAAALAPEWPALLAARRWLDDHRGAGLHVREVSASGVDTKFMERHRTVLAAWLGVPASAAGFLDALGLARKPATVRLRVDPGLGVLAHGATEAVLRADELGAMAIDPALVLVVENEITYLSVPVPVGGLVIWGRGYDVDPIRRLAWLTDVPVVYWGDLDTHGFAILDRLRGFLPQARSILMDRHTLLEHEPRWGREPTPTSVGLERLTEEEQALYRDLVTGRYGIGLRLEQERVDWAWAMARLPSPAVPMARRTAMVEVTLEDLSTAEVDAIERRAAEEGQTAEGFVRRRLIEEAQRDG